MIDTKRQRLEAIDARDGGLKLDAIIADAADPSSPLHSSFTWDDSKAAAKWRRYEARQLIAQYELIERVRQWEWVPSRKQYLNAVAILETPALREEVLAEMKRDWEIFRDRYRSFLKMPQHAELRKKLDELSGFFDGPTA